MSTTTTSPRAPISACLIIKNEAAVLADCLASIRPYVEEIVVVDTGSTDTSIEIAQAAGARVLSIAWPESFSAARNIGLAAATQPAIFIIDADERLVPDTAAALVEHCRRSPGVAASVIQRNVSVSSGRGDSRDSESLLFTVRLFPNRPTIRYAGRVHEHVVDSGEPIRSVPIDVELLHLGYTPEQLVTKDKFARNLALLELDLQDAPGDPYALYQIGRTHCVNKRFGPATRYLVEALNALAPRFEQTDALPRYASSLVLQLAQAATGSGQLSTVLQALSLGVQHYPDFTDLYFAYGTALLELGDTSHLEEIRAAFENCLKLGEPDCVRYESVRGVGSFRALHNLGVYHEVTGQGHAARDHYQRAAELGFAPSVERLHNLSLAA